ncbi:MAG: fluoride efflux transporter CrcB [Prosthecochloris sp.]|uniref:Fluoride-specific ion channel FluC n=1 Tax=Prosthecochloris aestuarii (strain DSM 271 / SK 413) TaxID=290512 RepID=FLUC_PROA2|nr:MULTISPECIES: fluoride efflux transporter CrcB [Prosthecochloris]B4S3Q4.1 RecName: Full=Fluoride-specific ion channel FluC [Prosthecochloris aestuarii DSM 271]ACF45250.1 CrcB protein [Prosthecochloris aestuarii DSM 271]MCW8798758.1 fluoride efflux transporter CrcB [Prosthecochloris sp.]NEX12579.1 fluoride efflux transporter CrcB [Prosthecochloris sp.]
MQERFSAVLLVGAGGFAGASARYLIAVALSSFATGFPMATMLVNVLGCFLIGMISELSLTTSLLPSELRLLLATGFCGGFTTFSSYMYEISALLKDGELFYASLYLIGSLVGGMVFLYLGMALARVWS